ncbi:threonylcarbamoyl-AMP synthase [Rhodococcus wratislaviensis]|nr:threonylcarbamoyl-AMP synthase [Rhodococcus sp. 3A]MBC2897458.1 threonylcarbamoyl-AMP synthase [Rhodococcus sp. 4CII]
MTTVYDCHALATRKIGISHADTALRSGRLVAFPTDTLYAVGSDAFNREAVHALLAAKQRGGDKPASVLVGNSESLDDLVASVPLQAQQLIHAFWPGALSLVLRAAPHLCCDLGRTHGTIMVRMPRHPVALELLEAGPIAQSSANQTGRPPATTAEQARDYLGAAVSVYLDGGATGNLPSTIVDLSASRHPTILREGAISRAEISDVLELPLPAGPRALHRNSIAPATARVHDLPGTTPPQQPVADGEPW